MRSFTIRAGKLEMNAELNDGPTAQLIWNALPMEGKANRWGDEIYFSIPVQQKAAADARADMEVGELAYWPLGCAFCIFFGPTPASDGNRPRAASPVNPIGHVVDDVEPLKTVSDGASVRIEKA